MSVLSAAIPDGCVACNGHVPTGSGMLLLDGDLNASREFTVRQVHGLVCRPCVESWDEDGQGAPITLDRPAGRVIKLSG